MRVDALNLWAVAGELSPLLRGARIETVIAPTPYAIALEWYGGGQKSWLLLSAHPQLGRVHLLPERPRKLIAEPPAFVMLLRKYLEGSRIDAVRAVPWERIIRIDAGRGPAFDRVWLIAEVMGNLANIILVDDEDQRILGALRPVSLAVNHYRAILPGHPYIPPPPQTRQVDGVLVPRLMPERALATDLAAAALGSDAPAWRILASHVAGQSQDLAREVVGRALGDPLAIIPQRSLETWDAVVRELRTVADRAERLNFAPVALLDSGGVIKDGALWPPCAPLAPADLRQEPRPSVNELLAEYFAAREFRDALSSNAADLRRILKTARERLEKKLIALQGDLDALRAGDTLRAEGDLLLAFANEIPEGATSYVTPDLGVDLAPRVITLDPRLTAIENANQRFARYHKMKRAAIQIPPQIERATTDLAIVAQIQTDLDLSETLQDLVQVRAEIAEARLGAGERAEVSHKPAKKPPVAKGGKPGKGNKPAKVPGGDPIKFRSEAGFTFLVGKNRWQNEYVTFSLATGNDLWLHARGVPGAHVIVKSGGRDVPRAVLDEAASFAAWYSQSRGNASVAVDYTQQRYVRHMKDGGPGMVIYTHERTLPARPRDPESANH